jgi:hypothetical protein
MIDNWSSGILYQLRSTMRMQSTYTSFVYMNIYGILVCNVLRGLVGKDCVVAVQLH